MDAIPVSPNESSPECSPEPSFGDFDRTAATPTPSAMMKGTVMGPVVAPPESNATPWNVAGVRKAIAKTARYETMRTALRGTESTVLKMPSVTNRPTPAAIDIISPHLDTPLAIPRTWSART